MSESDVADLVGAADAPVLVVHRHADRDSLGAALGLAQLLDQRATVCVPEAVAAPAQPLLDGRDIVETVDASEHDLMVVLDAPSSDRIRPVDPFEPLVVIDHHAPGDLSERAIAAVVDEGAGSTAELVHRVAGVAGWDLSTAAAYPLVVGILDDTGILQAAGPAQIRHVVDFLPHVSGREADLVSLFDPSPQPGERTARIKATARASFYSAGDVTLAITRVGGFESAAAHALRDVGIDCALVWSDQAEGVRVVGRCSAAFADRVSLGAELFPALADVHGGSGGGHDTAAGATLKSVPDDGVTATLERTVADALGVEFGRLG
jgi:nanoRNase/pAp phosphatase (c-di-AMP/oligoRNAs hydrolase)